MHKGKTAFNEKHAEIHPKYDCLPQALARYSHAYGTNLQPELFLLHRLCMLSRGHFWRLEAREVRIPKLELQAVNPPPEPTDRWFFCFWAQIFTAQKVTDAFHRRTYATDAASYRRVFPLVCLSLLLTFRRQPSLPGNFQSTFRKTTGRAEARHNFEVRGKGK
jgi:hypothetical protein